MKFRTEEPRSFTTARRMVKQLGGEKAELERRLQEEHDARVIAEARLTQLQTDYALLVSCVEKTSQTAP